MKCAYNISVLERSAQTLIHREFYNSDEEYESALKEADGKIVLEIKIESCGQQKRIQSAITRKEEWKVNLRESLDMAALQIIQRETTA